MNETNVCYVVKLFSIKYNKFTYLYASNPYRTVYEANKFSSYEEGLTRMENFFRLNADGKDFDMNKSKVCKITFIEEDM